MSIDIQRVADRIAEIAEDEIMNRFGKLSPTDIRAKSGPQDFVTEADEAAERRLESVLKEISPDAAFIGEERAAADPSIVEALAGDGAFWIVDPLDGTRNFINGKSEFGSIVAYVVDGQTQIGWIYAAPDRKCALVERGNGAEWAGAPLTPSPPSESPPRGLRSIGWLTPKWRGVLPRNLKENFTSKSMHCSAYAYLKTALGEVDFKVSSRLHPWDHAAGVLLVEETGGVSSYLDDGAAYRPGPSTDRPLLVSASGRDHNLCVRMLTAPAAAALN